MLNAPENKNLIKNSGSLFANYEEFQKAAIYAHQHFLAKPYNNGLNAHRWANQRSILQLDSGEVVSANPQDIYGIVEATELANEKKARNDKSLVTLDEIVAQYNTKHKAQIDAGNLPPLKETDIGNINIPLVEKRLLPHKVVKIVHRPNHDIMHSIRAAAFITPIHQLANAGKITQNINTQLDNKHIEKLQMMMLFSVLGREDETGWSDAEEGSNLYQSYRAVDAMAFMQYCLENWDKHYKNVFKNKDDLYQAALIVELMGFPQLPDVTNITPPPVMKILMEGYSEENLQRLKQIIHENYPHNNLLRGYTDQQLKALFSDHKIPYHTAESNINLTFMNYAHGIDLMRCYAPGNPSIKKQNGPTAMELPNCFYELANYKFYEQGKLGNASAAKEAIEFFQYSRKILDTCGEKNATDIEQDNEKIQEVIENATQIEKLLFAHRGKKLIEIINEEIPIKHNGHASIKTLGKIIEKLNLENALLDEYGLHNDNVITGNQINGLVSRYFASHILKYGNHAIYPQRFNFCHYKEQEEIGKNIDLNNDAHRDYTKDVQLAMNAIDNVPRPEFTQKTDFPIPKVVQSLPKVFGVSKSDDAYFIQFQTKTEAEQFIARMHENGELMDVNKIDSPNGENSTITVSHAQFEQIENQLRYHIVKPPKIHNDEANLFTKKGEYRPLALIQDCQALIGTMNTTSIVAKNVPDYDWYLNQLNNPVEQRPVRIEATKGDRRDYRVQRTNALLRRTYTSYEELSKQMPITENPRKSQYWDQQDQPKVKKIVKERGRSKNILFAKKASHSLLRPDGKMLSYDPPLKTADKYLPIGILSDVNETHLHGEQYIWRGNVTSNAKFWIGDQALDEHINRVSPERGKGISLNDLQAELIENVKQKPDEPQRWNELLVGNSKTATKALFATQNNLFHRLNLLQHFLRIREQYGIDVPLMIIDGHHAPKMYTEAMIKEDLTNATKLLNKNQFPYLDNRSKAVQKEVLKDLFKTLSGTDKFTKIQSKPKDIEHMLNKVNLIGGESREMAFMENEWQKGIDAQSACMIRASTLGHLSVIEKMIQKGFDVRKVVNPATGETAFDIAVKNQHGSVVKYLRDAKSDIRAQYTHLGKKDTVLSKSWFAHQFPHKLRGDQKDLLQTMIDQHLAKAKNGRIEDSKILLMTLDMLEQSMYKKVNYATHAPSRLQTLIDDLRKEIGPVVINEAEKMQLVNQIQNEVSKGKFSDAFKKKIEQYDADFRTEKKQPTYHKPDKKLK